MASTAAAAWVYFGAHRPISAGGTGYAHSFWMAAPGKYRVPEAIIRVARERSRPFLHRSFVARMGSANVQRVTWHTPFYSLCSQWDQPGEPTSGLYKESRRHMLKWVSDKPSSTFVVCMENPAKPYAPNEKRANALGYGENAYSRYMQHEGTLLGLYAVPEKVKVIRPVPVPSPAPLRVRRWTPAAAGRWPASAAGRPFPPAPDNLPGRS